MLLQIKHTKKRNMPELGSEHVDMAKMPMPIYPVNPTYIYIIYPYIYICGSIADKIVNQLRWL